jgi:hypothetical protein
VGHESRSSGLFYVDANQARVFQFGLKTSRGATAGGVRDGSMRRAASDASTPESLFSCIRH